MDGHRKKYMACSQILSDPPHHPHPISSCLTLCPFWPISPLEVRAYPIVLAAAVFYFQFCRMNGIINSPTFHLSIYLFLNYLFHVFYSSNRAGISGAVAKTATAPIERVKLIIQTQDANPLIKSGEVARYTGIGDCFTRVYKEQGMKVQLH